MPSCCKLELFVELFDQDKLVRQPLVRLVITPEGGDLVQAGLHRRDVLGERLV